MITLASHGCLFVGKGVVQAGTWGTSSPSRNHLSRLGFVRPARQDHGRSGPHLAVEAHPNQVSQEAQETVSVRQEIGSINLTGMQENLHILYRYQSPLLYHIPYHRPRLRRRRLPFLEYKPQDRSDPWGPKGTRIILIFRLWPQDAHSPPSSRFTRLTQAIEQCQKGTAVRPT